MTLILTCITKDAIYQLSDRRLTNIDNPNDVRDDERNKAVLVEGRVVLGYTGLAMIGKEPTDIWLAHVIASGSTDNMAEVVEA